MSAFVPTIIAASVLWMLALVVAPARAIDDPGRARAAAYIAMVASGLSGAAIALISVLQWLPR